MRLDQAQVCTRSWLNHCLPRPSTSTALLNTAAHLRKRHAVELPGCQVGKKVEAHQASSMAKHLHRRQVVVKPVSQLATVGSVGCVHVCHKYAGACRCGSRQTLESAISGSNKHACTSTPCPLSQASLTALCKVC